MLGSQTAVVVGPDGQEIYTNEQGQVKVQFHWDRLGHQDDQSSCWVRVSQPWAGEGYGFMFIPRVGNEVVVDFLEGDPDRPLITGSVYHVQNPPPLDLPNQQTRSTIKSRSTPNSDGFNEIRFEDQADAEEIYTHAQRNQTEIVRADHSTTVGHDQTRKIKNDRRATIEQGNDFVTVGTGKRVTTVQAGAKLEVKTEDRTVQVRSGDYRLDAMAGNIREKAAKAVSITGSGKGVHIVGRGAGVTVTGSDGPGVDVSGRGKVGINAFGHPKVKVRGGESIYARSPKIEMDASEKVFVHVGENDKVVITGGNIIIKSGTVHVAGETSLALAGGAGRAQMNATEVKISGPVIKLNT